MPLLINPTWDMIVGTWHIVVVLMPIYAIMRTYLPRRYHHTKWIGVASETSLPTLPSRGTGPHPVSNVYYTRHFSPGGLSRLGEPRFLSENSPSCHLVETEMGSERVDNDDAGRCGGLPEPLDV